MKKLTDQCVRAQWCPTLCNPMDCSWPGSSVHGIFQTRILERVAISFSRGSSWSRDQTQVSCSADKLFTWATKDTCILIVQVNIWGTTFTGLTRITHLSLINHFVFLGQYTVPGSGSLSSNPEIGTWLQIPGCLALGEWSHYCDYLGHKDHFI